MSCGCGGIGRRAWFRSMWAQVHGGSSPFIRSNSKNPNLADASMLANGFGFFYWPGLQSAIACHCNSTSIGVRMRWSAALMRCLEVTGMGFIQENLPFLIPLIVIQLGLMIVSLVHVLRHKTYRFGNRPLWIVVCLKQKDKCERLPYEEPSGRVRICS